MGGELVTDEPTAVDIASDLSAETLRHCFAEALQATGRGTATVAADDDFFALGGDSLGIAQLAVRLRERWGLGVNPRDVFLAPTPAALLRLLRSRQVEQDGETRWPDLIRRPRPVPLSPPQRRLWYLDQLHRSGGQDVRDTSYNLSVSVRFEEPLDPAALSRSMDEIAAHVRGCIADGSFKPRVDDLPFYDGPVDADITPR